MMTMTKADRFALIEDYNAFLVSVVTDQQGPVAGIEFDQMLKIGMAGYFLQQAVNEMKAVLGDDESGDQPGT